MERNILYEIDSLYRDNFRVTGFQFGEGEKSICIVGSMRGNEYQQIYTCSQLVKKLKRLEEKGRIEPGKSILVIPCANPYSVNTKKRFWTIDNTDINRMFPGYDLGETTQRIAGGIFEQIKDYRFGVQFASFYMPGNFVPQVRMMKTGLENIELAGHFGLPYVVLHDPRPFDTATLNYNWQIWETKAFSVYANATDEIDEKAACEAVNAILRFMDNRGLVSTKTPPGYRTVVLDESETEQIQAGAAGLFFSTVEIGATVEKDDILGRIVDPFECTTVGEIRTPVSGTVYFAYHSPLINEKTVCFKIIK